MANIRQIDQDWITQDARGQVWKYQDLSGDHLGVRIEELAPGATSSEFHYHTTEEEHVLILSGSATLILGDTRSPLSEGQHVWFRAGEAIAHCIENTSDEPFRFLVFGERKSDDVVVYPEHQVMLLKSLDNQRVTYRQVEQK